MIFDIKYIMLDIHLDTIIIRLLALVLELVDRLG